MCPAAMLGCFHMRAGDSNSGPRDYTAVSQPCQDAFVHPVSSRHLQPALGGPRPLIASTFQNVSTTCLARWSVWSYAPCVEEASQGWRSKPLTGKTNGFGVICHGQEAAQCAGWDYEHKDLTADRLDLQAVICRMHLFCILAVLPWARCITFLCPHPLP